MADDTVEAGDRDDTEQEEKEGVGTEFASNLLTEEIAGECLSLLCKTSDGLTHAYVNMDLKDRQLSDVSLLSSFIHVRYLDISGNYLEDISAISSLSHLLTVKADRNLLISACVQELPYLQSASFANNKIASTQGIAHPMLETLNLSGNRITELQGFTPKNLPNLQFLDLHNNLITSCAGINLPTLSKLYMASNKLTKIEGLGGLTKLTILHLRENQISTLDGFVPSMESLQYLNLRGNTVAELSELKKLELLPFLRALILSGCPVSELDDYRLEVLIAVRKLERLDKDAFTEDERADAEEVHKERSSSNTAEN